MAAKKKSSKSSDTDPIPDQPVVALSEEELTIARDKDDEARRAIADQLDVNLLIEAGAGSGKTTELVKRMLNLIRTGKCAIEQLAAVTFTRKAAAELRDRFELELNKAFRNSENPVEKGRLKKAIDNFSRACIGTVHSFCARLLRERPIEAGLDLNFRELEEHESSNLLTQAWNQYLDSLYQGQSEYLLEANRLGLDLSDLTKGFEKFSANADIRLWRIDEINADQVLEFANQNGFWAQLKNFEQSYSSAAALFPPKKERRSDKFQAYVEAILARIQNIQSENLEELIHCMDVFPKECVIVQEVWPLGKADAKAVKESYSAFYASVIEPCLNRLHAARYRLAIAMYREALKIYQRLKDEAGLVDFQDLLIKTAETLKNSADVRQYLAARYPRLLVDEFQDTDPLQAEIMFLLTAENQEETDWQKCRPRPGSLFVVGDPKQSIYRFKRGDIQTYEQVKEKIVEVGAIHSLTRNFRTCSEVLDWINNHFRTQFPKSANPQSPAFEPMLSGREDVIDAPRDKAGLRRLNCPEESQDVLPHDQRTLTQYIAQACNEKHILPRKETERAAKLPDHAIPGDFLILHSKTKNLNHYAEELRQLGLPVEVTGGNSLSDQVLEIQALRDLLLALTEPDDPIALVTVLRGPLFGISDALLYDFVVTGGRFHFQFPTPACGPELKPIIDAFDQLKVFLGYFYSLPPLTAVQQILEESGLLASALSSENATSADALMLALETLRQKQIENPSAALLATFLQQVLDRYSDVNSASVDAVPIRDFDERPVRIMNLHKAKGLEASVVMLANPTGHYDHDVEIAIDRHQSEPIGYLALRTKKESETDYSRLIAKPLAWDDIATKEKEFLEAERTRLLYVAATRAGVQLVISHRLKYSNFNPWTPLSATLTDPAIHLPDPSEITIPSVAKPHSPAASTPATSFDRGAIEAALTSVAQRRQQLVAPTYAVVTAKELETPASASRLPSEEEGQAAATDAALSTSSPDATAAVYRGSAWGTVIHRLLEAAVRTPNADLTLLAEEAAAEAGLDPAAIPDALHNIAEIRASSFWQRVQAAEQVLTEVPFSVWEAPPVGATAPPTLIKGVIDLVFLEPGGWVLVDYKTDDVPPAELPTLLDTYRGQITAYRQYWEQLTGQKIKEAGLYSTRLLRMERA
jgi:ATP-dependent helicase/nuclease subunit A